MSPEELARALKGHHLEPIYSRGSIWQYRQQFLEAAQRKIPKLGRYLFEHGLQTDLDLRSNVIREWQELFSLREAWAFEAARITLSVWDQNPADAASLKWFARSPATNLLEVGVFPFEFEIRREFHKNLDFALFKLSVHGALEDALSRFEEDLGLRDIAQLRVPKDLNRAFECLALRVCARVRPSEIRSQSPYRHDWSTLFRDITSAGLLIGLRLPAPGRPKNIAR